MNRWQRVFEDMLDRSVPMYQECQSLAVSWCSQFAKANTSVYDLGCSTGTLLLKLAQSIDKNKNNLLYGIDSSPAMLEKSRITSQPVTNYLRAREGRSKPGVSPSKMRL